MNERKPPFLSMVLVMGLLCGCSRAPLATVNGVITQQEALIQAQDDLPKILKEWDENGVLQGGKIRTSSTTVILKSVRPVDVSYCRQPTSLPDSGFLNQTGNRLVWMVCFEVESSNPHISGKLCIYVDATDGSFVCSTYPLIM